MSGEQKQAGGEEEDEEKREAEDKSQVEEKAVMVVDTSSLDEHIIEYLPPALHKGNSTRFHTTLEPQLNIILMPWYNSILQTSKTSFKENL